MVDAPLTSKWQVGIECFDTIFFLHSAVLNTAVNHPGKVPESKRMVGDDLVNSLSAMDGHDHPLKN
jgi:hypothetical protein